MFNQKLLFYLLAFFCFLSAKEVFCQEATKKVGFSFTLKTGATTSAGVFKNDGTLIRTLWSNKKYEAGVHTELWDGLTDGGKLADTSDYSIKVISSNVKYTWEGVVGNTSQYFTGSSVYHHSNGFSDLVVVGNTGYASTGYMEGQVAQYKFSLSTPQQKQYVLPSSGGMNQSTFYSTTDGVNMYWAGLDSWASKPYASFVFATRVADDKEVIFPNGISNYQVSVGRKQASVISLITTTDKLKRDITGLTVQKNGNYLFVAAGALDTLFVLHKRTGALVRKLYFDNVRNIKTDSSGNIWMITGNQILAKYPINSNGTLGAATVTVSSLERPLALAVKTTKDSIYVIDAGTRQQIRVFSMGGVEGTPLGQFGGYRTNAAASPYKFFFLSDDRSKDFITFAPDGSFWVGDNGNNRIMHYSSNRTYLEDIMCLGAFHSCNVDPNNPTRVFADYAEFEVDYSKPLSPNNGSWKLKFNWGANVVSEGNYDDSYSRLKYVTTLSNGRTYGLVSDKPNQALTFVELVSGGTLRYTGLKPDSYGGRISFNKDGSYLNINGPGIGQTGNWTLRRLTGFDGNNNPTWDKGTVIAKCEPITPNDPIGTGNDMYISDPISSNGVVFSWKTGISGGYHLGGVKGSKWLFKTSPSTFKEYKGIFPHDGSYDIGNGIASYAGSFATAIDSSVFWGYNGEGWKANETNVYNHFSDDGLMIGQFGVTGDTAKSIEAFPGNEGNARSGRVVKVGSNYYLYHCSESQHGGVHRWKISGLETINEQIAILGESLKTETGIDLMAGLAKKVILSDTLGWKKSFARNGNFGKGYYYTQTGTFTFQDGENDIIIKSGSTTQDTTVAFAVSRDLGNNSNLIEWTLTGKLTYLLALDPDTEILEVLDKNNRVICQVRRNLSYYFNNIRVLSDVLNHGPLGILMQKQTPFTIHASNGKITFRYGSYSVTSPTFDKTADWQNPKTFRVYQSSDDGRGHQLVIANLRLSIIASENTRLDPPTVIADYEKHLLTANHPLGSSLIVVSENNGPFRPYTVPISVGNVSRQAGYWKFKIISSSPKQETAVVNSPTFAMTPTPPTLTIDAIAKKLSASHILGASEILVSENNSNFKAYGGEIGVGNVARPAGYWKFKIRSLTLRNESNTVNSPQFTITSDAPILTADDVANTLSASHSLGNSEILVSENGGSYKPYLGTINVTNRDRPAGFWKFKIKSVVTTRSESEVVTSPVFTYAITPNAPKVTADDVSNTLIASHPLGSSEILLSENNGNFEAYTRQINVGNIARPEGYWKFKIKSSLPTRNESIIVNSPAFTIGRTPDAPILNNDDVANTLIASHFLGNSEILVSENGGSYKPYQGTINVTNRDRPAGFWKFKIKALVPTRTESAVVNSPAFTYAATPNTPKVTADDVSNTLIASHALGSSEILLSENNGDFEAYTGQINVGNIARPAGYWKFKIKAALPTRNESLVVNSPAFTIGRTPDAPILNDDDVANTLIASHALGNTEILVSENGGSYKPYQGTINVTNRDRPAGFWKFKIKALVPTRTESTVVSSPAFTYAATPNAPRVTANDVLNTLSASHALGTSEILISENNGDFKVYTGQINLGNIGRPEGYWKFKIKSSLPTRNESPTINSPAFTIATTPDAPTLKGDDAANTLIASHPLGNSEILVSENGGSYKPYVGTITVTDRDRPAGFWKFKVRALAPTRTESAVISSPAFNYSKNYSKTTARIISTDTMVATNTNLKIIKNDSSENIIKQRSMLYKQNLKTEPRTIIYPNPVTGNTFNVNLIDFTEEKYNIRLRNTSGNVLMTQSIYHKGKNVVYRVDIGGATASGIYIVEIVGKNSAITSKIFKN